MNIQWNIVNPDTLVPRKIVQIIESYTILYIFFHMKNRPKGGAFRLTLYITVLISIFLVMVEKEVSIVEMFCNTKEISKCFYLIDSLQCDQNHSLCPLHERKMYICSRY
jgi:hypothetical protein